MYAVSLSKAIQFSVSLLFGPIWSMDCTRCYQRGPVSDDNEGVLRIP